MNYTGLIEPPKSVRFEQITGHSAVVVWNKGCFLYSALMHM